MIRALASYVDRDYLPRVPMPEGSGLMLDSGAFSAHTRGVQIDLGELTSWYRDTPADLYAALDVIYDPASTRANAITQRDLGADVFPTVHAGTDPAEVDRLAADGFGTIALGGMVAKNKARPHLYAWMHTCLDRADALGLKVHGFGFCPITPKLLPLLMRFSTVDIAGWASSKYGWVFVWDGTRVRVMSLAADRLLLADLTRRWPLDLRRTLVRQRGDTDGSSSGIYWVSAASYLLYGQWLTHRGGPKVYLAAYHSTFKNKPGTAEVLTRILAALDQQTR